MKFKILLFFFLIICACTNNLSLYDNQNPYNAKGLAYIFKDEDYDKKIIKKKLDNNSLQIAHSYLKIGTPIKLINPQTKKSIVLKNSKRIKYPDFYKIMITKSVADKLDLSKEIPLVEIIEIKKNKSFVAKKAKIFNEEKKISSNAPVTSVKISNISKDKSLKKQKLKNNEIYITVATFYSFNSAKFLKKRIVKEIPEFNSNNLKIREKNSKEVMLIAGPYKGINILKNDYIKLKEFGFEELDISFNE